MSAFPLITLGIPVYNGEKFIGQSIQSVLDQTYTSIELLILDNHSTDNTPQIVSEYAGKDKRINYIRNAANIGYINNFNLIPKYASGDYIIYFADDDILDKEYVMKLWKGLENNPRIAMAVGNIQLISQEGKVINEQKEFTKAHVSSTLDLSAFQRAARVVRYGHYREWSWGILLGLHRKELLIKYPFRNDLIDPGTLFYRTIIMEGDVYFDSDAIFYKRLGGMSDGNDYGLSKITIRSKYADLRNEWRQLRYEIKAIFTSRFSFIDKLRLFGVFASYRMLVLFKRIFIFTASLFIFIFIKKPVHFFKSLAR